VCIYAQRTGTEVKSFVSWGISPGRGFSHAKRAGVSFGFPRAENTRYVLNKPKYCCCCCCYFYFTFARFKIPETGNKITLTLRFFFLFFFCGTMVIYRLSSFSLFLSPPPPLFPYLLFRIAIRVANAVETSITISSNVMHINFFFVVNGSGRFRYRITYRKIFYLETC